MVILIHSKIADEIQYLYRKILLRPAREFEIENYLKNLDNGNLQLPDIEKSLYSSHERQLIDSLNKVGEGPVKTKDGINMYLDPIDYDLSGYISVHNIWEPFETFLFKQFIKKNTVFVDIGAHIGYYSLLCASIAKEGTIISFEPVPRNFKFLEKNIRLNKFKHIKAIKKAISNDNRTSLLFLSNASNTGDNRFFEDSLIGENNKKESIKVSCLKLDDFLAKSKLSPNMIKIDIQGGEMLALLGMKKILKSSSKLVLFCEFWPGGISAMGESPQEFLDMLDKNGFKIFEINEHEKKLETKSFIQLIADYTKEKDPLAQTNLLILKNVQEPKIKN